ncbi:hypothetical protein Glo7428_2930 [Gloeocapsa sp. PCC 7428]|nr:hypothetical protein Glo7428_2930 [Gloeocapsa sp. PCC 7428]
MGSVGVLARLRYDFPTTLQPSYSPLLIFTRNFLNLARLPPQGNNNPSDRNN